jgi:hypothetical protein
MSANTLITSIVTGGTNSHTTTSEEANALATDFVTQGVVGAIALNSGSGGTGSFCVNADGTPDMGVTIKSGQAYVTATPSSQNSQVLRIRAASDYTAYTINANSSGSTKYDWIYLKVDTTKANNPAADASDVTSLFTSRSSSNTTDNGSPPTYGLLLAVVTVANGASSITNSNISDKRFNTSIGAQNGSLIVTQQSTGSDAKVLAAGTDANINVTLTPKGTGFVGIGENGNSVSQLNATGSDSNIDLKLVPKGTGLIRRNNVWVQAITTNAQQNDVIQQFGWSFITGDGTNWAEKTITFPVALTTVLWAGISPLGLTSGADPTAITSFSIGDSSNVGLPHIKSITTSTMVVRNTLDSGATLSSSIRQGFTWWVLGIK